MNDWYTLQLALDNFLGKAHQVIKLRDENQIIREAEVVKIIEDNKNMITYATVGQLSFFAVQVGALFTGGGWILSVYLMGGVLTMYAMATTARRENKAILREMGK